MLNERLQKFTFNRGCERAEGAFYNLTCILIGNVKIEVHSSCRLTFQYFFDHFIRNMEKCPQCADLSTEHVRTVLDDLANYLEQYTRLTGSADDASTMVVFKATVLQHLRSVRRKKVSLGCLKNQMVELGYLEHEAHRSTGEHVRGWKKDGAWLFVPDF